MDQLVVYILLLAIISIVGAVFSKAVIPTSLILAFVGMLLSFLPHFPQVKLNPKIVLEFFLPLLVYQSSAQASWRDIKLNLTPIISMSIGHVLFITFIVAFVIHHLVPSIGWPLAFVLGAVVSPPDTVALVALSEKMGLPLRITTILKGEGLLNDATALIIFRIALAAVVTHAFSPTKAISTFVFIVIGESLYGLALGFLIGEIRWRIREPMSQTLISLLTPFLAFLPPHELGGSGVLSTVLTGFVIGHFYLARFKPEIRLLAFSVWSTLSFAVESFLFLMLGLDFRFVVERISSISAKSLALYSITIVLAVIIGRFLWVYPTAYLARFFSRKKQKKTRLPWQNPFIVSWSGMRGAVSLAAALAIPMMPVMVEGANANDLIVFLVFCVIIATLLFQGMALPWVVKILGVKTRVQCEQYQAHVLELSTRMEMIDAVLLWLNEYKELVKDNSKITEEVKYRLREYQRLKKELNTRIKQHQDYGGHDERSELEKEIFLSSKILEVERNTLARLWRENKVNYAVRNRLLEQLDFRSKH